MSILQSKNHSLNIVITQKLLILHLDKSDIHSEFIGLQNKQ